MDHAFSNNNLDQFFNNSKKNNHTLDHTSMSSTPWKILGEKKQVCKKVEEQHDL